MERINADNQRISSGITMIQHSIYLIKKKGSKNEEKNLCLISCVKSIFAGNQKRREMDQIVKTKTERKLRNIISSFVSLFYSAYQFSSPREFDMYLGTTKSSGWKMNRYFFLLLQRLEEEEETTDESTRK